MKKIRKSKPTAGEIAAVLKMYNFRKTAPEKPVQIRTGSQKQA